MTPKNTEISKRKAPRKSIAGTMKSIEKNKRTLNVPLTGRLASVGAPKHLKILSNPEIHLTRDSSNPSIKKNLRLKKNTEAYTAKQLNEHLDTYINNQKDLQGSS